MSGQGPLHAPTTSNRGSVPRPPGAFGHGKAILLGEHAVVFGEPALAAGLSVGVRAEAHPGSGKLEVAPWGLLAQAGDGSQVGAALEAICARLGVRDRDVLAEASVPSRAGLGSSAALSVAVARALAGPAGDEVAVREAVDAAERVFHGRPSGIDAAAALSGGTGAYHTPTGWRAVAALQRMTLCVGLSGKPRDTATQVAAVARLVDRTPVVRGVVAALGALAAPGEEALVRGDVDALGRLFDVAHGLLAALGVSSPELDALVHAARAAGAVGAKLTGAGGGGAVIALAPGHEKDVLARWRKDGFEGFLTEIGA